MVEISRDINKAKALLNSDDVVAIPTETVYGLAGNIFSEKAVRKIFELKGRPLYNPLIVHTYSLDQLDRFVRHIPEQAKRLAEAFWPGPLTLILPKIDSVPSLITAGKDTVGIRIPNHPLTLELLSQLDFPLAAPSANTFGNISPTRPEHVSSYFESTLSMVLDGGPCPKGIESTIVGFEGEEAVIYRLGSISIEDIEEVIGTLEVRNKKEAAPDAPGMLSRHYAPSTTTYLVDDVLAFLEGITYAKVGVITFKEDRVHDKIKQVEILSPEGHLKQAAAQLYAAMHRLDAMDLDAIVAERFPDEGLGKSINDRLERATKTL